MRRIASVGVKKAPISIPAVKLIVSNPTDNGNVYSAKLTVFVCMYITYNCGRSHDSVTVAVTVATRSPVRRGLWGLASGCSGIPRGHRTGDKPL